MTPMDPYSYACGAMDSFCEIVGAGVKKLALSHPEDSAAARDAYVPFAEELCAKYGIRLHLEDALLETDLFPLSGTRGKHLLLFYRDPAVLRDYQALKERGGDTAAARKETAQAFGRLLSYSDEAIDRLIAQNTEKAE